MTILGLSRRMRSRRWTWALYPEAFRLEPLDPYLLMSAVSVVLVDNQLQDWAMLRHAAASAAIVVAYDPRSSSAAGVLSRAVRAATAAGATIDSLTVLGHGRPGAFQLGGDWISSSSLSLTLGAWQALSAHFDRSARIYLYGCDVDESGAGQTLLDRLARATHASVYASSNLTGRGGDWALEASSSGAAALQPSQASLNIRNLAGYQGQLAVGIFSNNQDIGAVGVAGSSTYSSGTYTVKGSGSDIWGTSDQFQYAYTSATGAATIIARVTAVQNTNATAKGGVMFRDSAATDAVYAMVAYQPTGGITFQYRASTGAIAINGGRVNASLPVWVKLVRDGSGNSTFSGYSSTDGTTWTLIGSTTVTMTSTALVGLAVTAKNNSKLNTSTFDNVSLSGSSGPTVATPASATPNPVTGTTSALSVLGADPNGESTLTYTWSATAKPAGSNPIFSANGTNAAKNSTVTFDRAGSYTLLVTISDGSLSTTSSVNVTVNQTLTSIVVSPSSASLNLNQTQQFSATGYDQFGQTLTTQPSFTWSKASGVGSINSTGLYSSGSTAGSATVQASSGGVNGTANVTVTNAAPTVATPALANPSPVNGTTTALSVLGADDGGEANLIYTWSATSKPAGSNPIFSANGTNSAKNSTVTFDRAGSYTFLVTISDGGLSVTSSVNVTVNQTLTSIVVSPSSAGLNLNQTQQFSATGYDQFGQALTTQPSFTWSKASGVGSISSSGLYSCGASAGSAIVQASSGGVSGNATITVTNAAPTVLTPANASPAPVIGTSTNLSVLASDDGGESNLTYTWSTTSQPAGANPVFSVNGSNAAKNATVTFDRSGSYTFLVTIGDGTNTVTSSVTVSVNQTLTTIAVSPATATLNLNQSQPFTATGYDQFGQSLASQPAFTWSLVSGVGGVSAGGLYTSGSTAGSATVKAASGAITGSASVTVANAAPTITTPAYADASTVSGTSTGIHVAASDDGGAANLTYTWSATSMPTGANPSFSANGSNAAQDTTVTFDLAGSYTFLVTVSDGALTATSSVTVTVNQTFTSLVVSPAVATVNINQTQPFTALAYDQFGDLLSSAPAVNWSLDAGSDGSLDSTGLFSAGGSTGSAVVRATAGPESATASVTISAGGAPVVTVPANATPNPVSGTGTNLSVLATDDGGEPNLTYTWSLTSRPIGSNPVFSSNGENAAKNTGVTFDRAGTYNFLVTISDGVNTATSSVTVSVNQTLTSIVVSPATAALHLNQTQPFSATGFDQFGQILGVQPAFTWSVASGVGAVDGTGLFNSGGTAGVATVQAAFGSVTGSATVTVSDAPPTITTFPYASPAPVTGNTTSLHVLANDDGGAGNLIYTWSLTAQPGGSNPVFSVNASNASQNTNVTFDSAGTYTFLVTISDGANNITGTVDVVVEQTLSAIVVTPASATLNLNQLQPLAATALDQFGQALATQPSFTWSVAGGVGGVDASGVFSSTTTGVAVVRASSGAVNGTANITVTNAAPTMATPALANPSPVNGTSTALSVLGADDGGEANLAYTWSATTKPAGANPIFSANSTNAAKNSTVTFDRAGNYTFLVTISDGSLSTTSTVNVTVNQTLTSIVVSPSSASLNLNQTQQFSATGYDQFGQALTTQPSFTWSLASGVGGVSSGGLYSSGAAAGSAVIQASSGAVSGNATINVTNAAPTVLTPANASPALVTGTTTALSVLGADDGGESNLIYTWSTTSQPAGSNPIFSLNGSNAAKNSTVTFDRAGSYAFLVTISDGSLSTTSNVTVTVNQMLTTIAVSPATATLNLNQSQQFTATGYDQFGQTLASQPAFTWSLVSGSVGAVDASGLFAAGGVAGSATVRATASGLSATAGAVVTAGPVITVTPYADPAPVTGTTATFHVDATDDTGATLTYTWTLVSGPNGAAPGFSINGVAAAKDTLVTFNVAGTYTFTVTASDGPRSATASLSLTVSSTLASLVVSPASVTLFNGQSATFTAVGYDQFGDRMSALPTISWTASGAGVIDAQGVFTAAGSGAAAQVTAASGGISGSADVSLAPPSAPNPGPIITPPEVVPPPAPVVQPVVAPVTVPVTTTDIPTIPPIVTTSDTQGSPTPVTTPPQTTDLSTPTPAGPPVSDNRITPSLPAPTPVPATNDVPRQVLPAQEPTMEGLLLAAATPADMAPPPIAVARRLVLVPADLAHWSNFAQPVVRPIVDMMPRLVEVVPAEVVLVEEVRGGDSAADSQVLRFTVGTVAVASVAASAGYALWLARAGSILMSLLSSLPVWRLLDPLPVLDSWRKARLKRRWWWRRGRPANETDTVEQRVEGLMQ